VTWEAEGKDRLGGEEGELMVRGSNVFSATGRPPQKTAESFVTTALPPLFKTGDTGATGPGDRRRDPHRASSG